MMAEITKNKVADTLCELLIEKPEEWEDDNGQYVKHTSGVTIKTCNGSMGVGQYVWGPNYKLTFWEKRRVWTAYKHWLAWHTETLLTAEPITLAASLKAMFPIKAPITRPATAESIVDSAAIPAMEPSDAG